MKINYKELKNIETLAMKSKWDFGSFIIKDGEIIEEESLSGSYEEMNKYFSDNDAKT